MPGRRLGAEARCEVIREISRGISMEADAGVKRRIPGKVAIGRQRERGKGCAGGIGLGRRDEGPARTLAAGKGRRRRSPQCEGMSRNARQGGSRRFRRRSAQSSGGRCGSRPRGPPARSAVRRRPRRGRCREKGRLPIARWQETPRYRSSSLGGRRPSPRLFGGGDLGDDRVGDRPAGRMLSVIGRPRR